MEQMQKLSNLIANWNGQLMPLTEVKVSVLDRGFLFGDAVYEVIRLYERKLFRVEDHLSRLSDSLKSIDIKHVDSDKIRSMLKATVRESGLDNALIYLQITRGEAPRTHYYPDSYMPNVLMYATPFLNHYAKEHETGVSAVTHPDIRWGRNDIKATSLLANCMAAQYAREKGAMEVVFIDSDGIMTEGSHTSLFGILNDKLVVSPSSSKVLPGITKRQVLELAKETGVELDERRLKESEIYELDEFFLAGTPEELISIVKVNDKQIGDGKPGPMVKRLHKSFRDSVTRHLTAI
jgi:D-alanine transaminase